MDKHFGNITRKRSMEMVRSFRKAFKVVVANSLLQLYESAISKFKLASQINEASTEHRANT